MNTKNRNELIPRLYRYQLERCNCDVRIRGITIATLLTGLYATYMFLFEGDNFGFICISTLITGGLIFYLIQLFDTRLKLTREMDYICLNLFGKIYSQSASEITNLDISYLHKR